jgi:type IV secretory pathway VirB2 component (pilin)
MKFHRFSSAAARPLLLLGFTATIAFAQSSSFGTAAQGIAQEMIAIAKWVGIIIAVICGLSMAGGGQHGSHIGAKLTGLVIGLVLALFATPIVNWVQSL